MSEHDLNPVSVTQGDRILTGVGVDAEQLAETMERHAPKDSEPPKVTSEAPADSQPPKESRGQKRFAQLTSERDKEKNAREAAERERDDLRARLAAAAQPPATRAGDDTRTPPSHQASSTGNGEADRSTVSTRGKPTEAEVGTKYETYADFIEDLADWKAEQRLAAQDFDARIRSSIEADRASRTQAERETQEIARGRSAYADFDAVVGNASHLKANNWPAPLVDYIASLEEPEHIRYQLAKDPVLAEQIRTMNPLQAGLAIAKLIPAPAVATLASTAGAGTVTPPAPFQPVGAGGKSTVPPLAELPKKGGFDFDKSGYRERRAAELGRTRRR